MPPKESNGTADSIGIKLTDGELKVLCLAWQCFKTMPAIDTTKLAELGGYKTPASANAVYYSARKKVLGDVKLPPAEKTPKKTPVKATAAVKSEGGEEDDDEEAADTPVTATKMKATPRKRKAAMEGDETVAETPQEKKRAPRQKKVEVKDVTDQGEDGGDEIAVKHEIKAEDDDEDAAVDHLIEGAEEAVAAASEDEGAGGVKNSTEMVEESMAG